MNNIMFTDKAWEEYCHWQTQDKKTLKRINQLLNDIKRNINYNKKYIKKTDRILSILF